jgi:predicted dehydrogenase
MSFLNRLKKGKVAPVLKDKLDQLSAPNGSPANGHGHGSANGKAVETANGHATTTGGFSIRAPEPSAPRVVIIGAGSRGSAYARAITNSGKGHIVAVCEPAWVVRREFGRKYIWGFQNRDAKQHEGFPSWPEYIAYEQERRQRVSSKELKDGDDEFLGADAAFICVLDEMHVDVVKALAPLQLHIMCEKPLATTLEDCIGIYGSVVKEWEMLGKKTIFSICHVLRYSPHNMLLHKLVREEQVVGDVISIEHTEPVGWWHFTHSYVRSVRLLRKPLHSTY